MENWRGFLKNPKFIFTHSPFSPIHLFFNFPKLLNSYFLSFPSRSALIRVYLRQKILSFFLFFRFPSFLRFSYFKPLNSYLFFNFPKLLNSYFHSFPSRSALIRVYLRQKNPFLIFCFFVSSDFSPFFFHTAKLLQFSEVWQSRFMQQVRLLKLPLSKITQ